MKRRKEHLFIKHFTRERKEQEDVVEMIIKFNFYELSCIKSVVEVKEKNPEKPDKNKEIINQYADIFLGFFDFSHQSN